jgi:predicted PolB exonuclease-like 3'-5' exonuclease
MNEDTKQQEQKGNGVLPCVSNRFSISKTILSDFALFAIIDNQQNKVVCHLVYDNGEQYCDEMANKMLAGLNGC